MGRKPRPRCYFRLRRVPIDTLFSSDYSLICNRVAVKQRRSTGCGPIPVSPRTGKQRSNEMTSAAESSPLAVVVPLEEQPSESTLVAVPTVENLTAVMELVRHAAIGRGRTKEFSVTQEGTSAEAAFTVARERDTWTERENISLKEAFVMANKPRGVSADHFIRWIRAVIDDPETEDVPDHHKPIVLLTAREYLDPNGPAIAVPCSWSETTDHLWDQGREIRRGKRRPEVYRFIGTVKPR